MGPNGPWNAGNDLKKSPGAEDVKAELANGGGTPCMAGL